MGEKMAGKPRLKGKVYLVGCGPGSVELLTLRALKVLREADVVVYDRLVSRGVLRLAPPAAERIYVGKGGGEASDPAQIQRRINRLLVEKASEGKRVVRLKGGDPFIFGRGGEEAEALARAGVPFEVVPGVTSATGVPALASIPLTHRTRSSSFAVVTGHEDAAKAESRVRWEALASAVDTLVILMGVGRMEEISRRLIAGGLKPDTPVCVVEWGATRRQRVVEGSLEDIAREIQVRRVRPPAVIVVGDVVGLRASLGSAG